jgi:hypothetical protein
MRLEALVLWSSWFWLSRLCSFSSKSFVRSSTIASSLCWYSTNFSSASLILCQCLCQKESSRHTANRYALEVCTKRTKSTYKSR